MIAQVKSYLSRHTKVRFATVFFIVMACFSVFRRLVLADGERVATAENVTAESAEAVVAEADVNEMNVKEIKEVVEDDDVVLTVSVANDEQQLSADECPKPAAPYRNPALWSYGQCFPDLQETQLEVAQKYGVQPAETRDEVAHLVRSHALVDVSHSPFYRLDSLSHSMPYLVPRAQHLLNTICLNFIDSCQSKGIPLHLPIVTSVLRTATDVRKLQRGNKNATTNSCHCYGTTVDITYNKFFPVTPDYQPNPELTRWHEPLKRTLGEVLLDLRLRGLCYVKYERKQACFHLTCR